MTVVVSRPVAAGIVAALVGLCALAVVSYVYVGELQERIALIEEAMNRELTGLVFSFDHGAVELSQKKGQTMEAFVAEYKVAVQRYLEAEVE